MANPQTGNVIDNLCHYGYPFQRSSAAATGNSQLGSGSITGELGEGGMAVVYEIWNEQLGVKRAVKVLKPDYSREHWDRFSTEMKLMAQLDHPNIVKIHNVGVWHNLPYIEMERVDGWSLEMLVRGRGALPVDVTVAIALLVARALNYTHLLEYSLNGREVVGLLHRDLKPANILISRKGQIKLTDFGIATPVNVSMHTPDGSIVGSLQYIAPEQLEGKDIDCRADVFSFGCVLYEMLTGFQAFSEKNLTRLIPKRMANSYDPLSAFALRIPSRLRKLIESCLEQDVPKRPSDMSAVCRELGKVFNDVCQSTPEQIVRDFAAKGAEDIGFVRPRRRSSGYIPFAIAACLALLVAGATILSSGNSRHSLRMQVGNLLVPQRKDNQGTEVQDNASRTARLVDSLQIAYGTTDPLTIMKREDAAGNYRNVLNVSQSLSAKKANSLTGILLLTRAREATDELSDQFFGDRQINDAEFFLIKARWLLAQARGSEAMEAVNRAAKAPSYALSRESARQLILACRARCLTVLAQQNSDVRTSQEALACWKQLRHAFRSDLDNPLYKEATKNYYLLAGL